MNSRHIISGSSTIVTDDEVSLCCSTLASNSSFYLHAVHDDTPWKHTIAGTTFTSSIKQLTNCAEGHPPDRAAPGWFQVPLGEEVK
jgi:hypothetical protein